MSFRVGHFRLEANAGESEYIFHISFLHQRKMGNMFCRNVIKRVSKTEPYDSKVVLLFIKKAFGHIHTWNRKNAKINQSCF